MRVAVIVNGSLRRRALVYKKLVPELRKTLNVSLYATASPNDEGKELTLEAINNGCDLIIACGGDGTINQIINGILEIDFHSRPALDIYPVGSGNDFARVFHKNLDIQKLIERVNSYKTKLVDVGQVEFNQNLHGANGKFRRYFINELDLGTGPVVVQHVERFKRWLGGSVGYYFSILASFLKFKPFDVEILADWSWKGKIRSVAIANGRYYGHGLCIAPDSEIDDGLFGVFIAGNLSVLDFVIHSNTAKAGKYIQLEDVHYLKASSLSILGPPDAIFETDGELMGHLPIQIELLPKQLKILI